MRPTAIVLAVLIVALTAPVVDGQQLQSGTWITSSEDSYVVIVTLEGDFYKSLRLHGSLGPWSFQGNIFSSAGAVPGHLVGVAAKGRDIFFALERAGDVYTAGPNPTDWQLAANVFVVAGQSFSDDSFVALGTIPGGNNNGATVYALTSRGELYEGISEATWRYVGNVFGQAPVRIDAATWGRIKAERR